ncbi:MAG: hypothetical protein DRP95_04165 [Candidatus Latescibacterota bacterium]|nr:MAG: hypothetical protein DRP95_04165 [Candidatus Latescibacterota bacterium]
MLYLLAHAVADRYGTDREQVMGLMRWVHENVPSEPARPGISDNSALDILEHGHGVCGSQAEVLAAMAWYAGYPSRRVGVYNEVYPLEDGTPADAWECHGLSW